MAFKSLLFTAFFLASPAWAVNPDTIPCNKCIKPTEDVRKQLIERAQALGVVNRKGRTISQGPLSDKEPALSQALSGFPTLDCAFEMPDLADPLNGNTPKFICKTILAGKEQKLKVKYQSAREQNPGIWGEMLSTRLFWALGFPTDAEYPVHVKCAKCPPKPFDFIRDFQNADGRKKDGTPMDFVPTPFDTEDAIVELKFESLPIEAHPNQGWTWQEFDRIAQDLPTFQLLKPQRDALALLAAFVQHADNKPEQQRMICVNPAAKKTDPTCTLPALMIGDLGFTFGRGFDNVAKNAPPEKQAESRLFGTASLQGFRQSPLWSDPARCITDIRSFATGVRDGTQNKHITESGRQLLLSRFRGLSRADLIELFTVARMDRRGELLPDGKGGKRPPTVAEWVDAFEARVRLLEAPRQCPQN